LTSEAQEEMIDKLENMIATTMAQMKIPGLSLALIKDDQVIYARGFGARNLKENIPSTPNTLYGVGSVTKSFTALGIMQLAEKGKLDLQDPVSKYVPFKLGLEGHPIKIHHLLSHSSGLPAVGASTLPLRFGMEHSWIPMSSWEDFYLHVNGAQEEIAAEPGKRFFYNNSCYTILGKIIEELSGMKYEEYVKEMILKPLKMDRSTFVKEEFEKEEDIMSSYLIRPKEGKVSVEDTDFPFYRFVYAPGGLMSSVMELSNYLIANMNGGVFEGTKILDSSMMEEMHKIQIETDIFKDIYGMKDGGRSGYGYGWIIDEDFHGHKLVSHGGNIGVASAHLAFIPDLKIGIAAAENAGQGPVPIFTGALIAMMGKDPEKEIPLFEVRKRLGKLTGKYATYKNISKGSVVEKNGLLYLESKEGDVETSYPLIPETPTMENYRFHVVPLPGGRIPVEFTVDESGKVDMYLERNRYHRIGD